MAYGIGIAVVLIGFLNVLLKLSWQSTLLLGIFVLTVLPFHQRLYKKALRHEKDFYETALYLDTLLYAFVKEEKVILAMQDVAFTLPPGKMKDLINEVVDYMSMTFDDVEVIEEGLKRIEKEYPCQRITSVHQFMLHVEYYGGEIEKPVNLLLADKARWEQRIKQAMELRKKQFTDVVLSIAASLIICGAIVYLPVGNMDISKEMLVQVFAVLVIVCDEMILYQAQKYLSVDWIRMQLTQEEAYYMKKMEAYHLYDAKKEKKRSFFMGIIGCLCTGVAFYVQNKWVTVICMAGALFAFAQHRIGRILQRKNLVKEIKYAFPNWLLDLVLLLQSENVHVALQKSREHVPGVLQQEVYKLVDRLEVEPESSAPYHMFLADFHLPEVHSAMGILYGLSIGSSSNADKQISELVEKNLELLDIAETQLWKNSSSGLILLFLLPVLVASSKLIVDMVFMMLYFVKIPVL